MKIDKQIIKQNELLLKHLAKNLRTGEIDAAKIGAFCRLVSEYGSLVRLSKELQDEANNYYERMEREALNEISTRR